MRHNRRRITSRLSVVFLALIGTTAIGITGGNPASADVGVANWAKVGLGATAAAAATTVSSTITDATMFTSAAVNTSSPAVSDLSTIKASYASPDTGASATGVGPCATTAAIPCQVGGALSLANSGYGLFGFATSTPNADTSITTATTYSSGWSITGYFLSSTATNWISYRWNGSTTWVGNNPPCLSATTWNNAGALNATSSICSVAAGGTGTINVPPLSGQMPLEIELNYGTSNTFGWGGSPPPGGLNAYGNPRNTTVSSTSTSTPTTPNRALVTTRQCANSAGTLTAVSATGSSYVEAATFQAVVNYPGCASGLSVKSTTIVAHASDGTTPDKTIVTYTAPAAVVNGTDPLPIILYALQVDGTYQTCEQTPSPCAAWWSDSAKADKYQCRQGSTVLALTECADVALRYNGGSTLPSSTPSVANPDGTSTYNCFEGMGFSPLTWPKGLILSPFKCLFIPANGATAWKGQIDTIKNSGVFAVPAAIVTTTNGFVNAANDSTKTCNDANTQIIYKDPAHPNGIAKTTPISFCSILTSGGDEMQNTTLGVYLWNGARIMLVLWFGFYWYNRIAASAGATAEV